MNRRDWYRASIPIGRVATGSTRFGGIDLPLPRLLGRHVSIEVGMLAPQQVIDRHHLEVRAKLLELAAVLDRLDRARESLSDGAGEVGQVAEESVDPRVALWQRSLEVLQEPTATADRAERLQLLFSRVYSPQWRSEWAL